MVSNYPTQLHEVLLQLVILATQNFSLIEETWEKSGTNLSSKVLFFACVKCRFQHKQVWNRQENLCVSAFNLLSKLLVLFASDLYHLAEFNQLLSCLLWNEMRLAQAPIFFKFLD